MRGTIVNYDQIAAEILELVGGTENVSSVTSCATRLRITPKDMSVVQDDMIKQLDGIIGAQVSGSQYQVIVGQQVGHVLESFTRIAGIESRPLGDSGDDAKTPMPDSLMGWINLALDTLSACVTPMLPIITAAGLVKLIVAVIGPSMLGLVAAESDLVRLLTFVGDAGFYFFPVYAAYSSAKRFGANVPMPLFIAGIMLHPTLVQIVGEGNPFTVYGIPMVLASYASNFIPTILITWVQSKLERALDRIIPDSLHYLLHPLLTLLVLLPVALCVLGPLGTLLGQGIANFLVWLHQTTGPLSIALIAATWPLLITTGMHQALIAIALSYIGTMGFDDSILVGAIVSNYPMMAIGLSSILQAKDADKRSSAITSFITLALGGISEPTLFGTILLERATIIFMMIGGFVGGLYAGITRLLHQQETVCPALHRQTVSCWCKSRVLLPGRMWSNAEVDHYEIASSSLSSSGGMTHMPSPSSQT